VIEALHRQLWQASSIARNCDALLMAAIAWPVWPINDEPRRVAGFVGAVDAGVGRPRFGDQQL